MDQRWWDKIRNELSKSPSMSYIALAITVIIGAVASGLVNAISNAPTLLHTLLIVGFGVIVSFIAMVYFVVPYWKFKWKYGYLGDKDEGIAEKLYDIKGRADKARNIIDGIIAIQLFRTERHTTDDSIIVKFHKLFSVESSGADISPLRDKVVEVPITLLEWILNPKQPAPDFDEFLNAYVFEYILQKSRNIDAELLSILNNWNVKIPDSLRITGIHFNTIFNVSRILESGKLYMQNL